MNRLRWCTAAISSTIAAGVLFGAVGIIGMAPALARPTEAVDTPGTAAGTAGSERHSNGVGGAPQARRQGLGAASGDPSPRRDYPARNARRVPTEVAAAEPADPAGPNGTAEPTGPAKPADPAELNGTAEPTGPAEPADPAEPNGTADPAEPNGIDETHEWHWHWPCPIIWPSAGPVPFDAGGASNGVIAFVDLPPTYLPAVAPFSDLAAPRLPAFAIESLAGPPESGAGFGQAPPAPQGQPDRAATPAAVPLAGGITPPAAPVPQRPSAGAPPPEGRLGYPAYLRNADFAQVAAVALPGLAAILGVSALGGFLGYRQAKAGFVLRAAGTARFLP